MNSLVVKRAANLVPVNQGSEWLISEVIPTRSLCLLGAAPKQGKTMAALELSIALCSGVAAFGKYEVLKKGKVLYYAGEDSEPGLKKRIDDFARAKTHNVDELELYVITEQVLQIDTEEGKQAIKDTLELHKPDLVVFDNLARIHSSAENDATSMGLIFEFLQQLKRVYNCSILLVHHMGKDGSIRGSSCIDSYWESAMFLKAKNGQRYIDFKFRNYEDRHDIPYTIKSFNGALKFILGSMEPTVAAPNNVVKIKAPEVITHNIEDLLAQGIVVKDAQGDYKRVKWDD